MVAPILIGAGLIGAGTAGKFIAGRSRERAFNRAIRQRGREFESFNQERNEALDNFSRQLIPLSTQNAQNKVNALTGLSQAGEIGQAAEKQGLADIQQAGSEVFNQVPVSDVFGAATGPGAGVLDRQQAQMAPSQQALQNLSAGGLGRLAQQQANEDVSRQNVLANIGVQNDFQNVQQNNALRTADIGLRDLQSNLAFQDAMRKAGNKGEILNAFSGLAQQVGGGVMSFGSTTKPV